MTNMKRRSISIPDEIECAIFELKKTDEFCRCSVSELIRKLLIIGLDTYESKTPLSQLRWQLPQKGEPELERSDKNGRKTGLYALLLC